MYLEKGEFKEMINKLLSGLRAADNFTLTENAALTHKSTLNDLLDAYYHIPARRGQDNTALFAAAYAENPLPALKMMFYIRDVRGLGTGERESFRQCLRWLHNNRRNVFNALVSLIPEYGRWDDLIEYTDNSKVIELIAKQFDNDFVSKNPSLLSKWLPSVNTSSAKTRELGKQWARNLGLNERGYRKHLSVLRRKINVLERLMSANEFSGINYEHVPSRASKLYRKAFSKRDADRYVAYLKSVEKGEKKINASTLYPYEIVAQYLQGYYQVDATMELLWKALPNYADSNKNALCVVDTSGSMNSTIGKTKIRAIDVSVSLGLYIAERNTGQFKDYFVTFSSRPELQRVRGSTLLEKVKNLSNAHWDQNTDLQAVFDLILSTAVKNKVPAEDMPSHLFVISDMEFDSACDRHTNFQHIQMKYRSAGYEMPVLVFWNVQSRTTQTPVTEDTAGTILVSGLSATVFKNAINAKVTTPYDSMLEVLNADRYAAVEEALIGVTL